MDDSPWFMIFAFLAMCFGGIFGMLRQSISAVDDTLQLNVGKKLSLDDLRETGFGLFRLKLSLIALIRKERVNWRFANPGVPQRSGIPPPSLMDSCEFWHRRGYRGDRVGVFALFLA